MTKEEEDQEILALSVRWTNAAHAMQTGVELERNFDSAPTDPKHLRVDVNTAHVDHGSLVELLIQKGLITKLEYHEAIAEGMEKEKERYEKHLSDRYDREVSNPMTQITDEQIKNAAKFDGIMISVNVFASLAAMVIVPIGAIFYCAQFGYSAALLGVGLSLVLVAHMARKFYEQ
jgi:hypothetical protein